MDLALTRFERRDGATRDDMGNAALEYCRAMRAAEPVQSARFYWVGVDQIVVLIGVEEARTIVYPPSGAAAKAFFTLADTARQLGPTEALIDAGAGTKIAAMGGR